MSAQPAVFRLKAEAPRIKRAAFLLCLAALLAPACHRAIPPPSANPATVEDFHYSDPKTIAATGRPQLLEFVGPT